MSTNTNSSPLRFLTALCALVVFALGTATAQSPPRDLHLVGDHWTAWNPPEPPEGAEIYVIQVNDTLWDLADRYFSDPYLWPQLWELNRYIEDAHWIYPGDPLVVSIGFESTEMLDEATGEGSGGEIASADEETSLEEPSLWGTEGRFAQLGSLDDLQCSGHIGADVALTGHQIVGTEYESLVPNLEVDRAGVLSVDFSKRVSERVNLTVGDIVYLSAGYADGLTPGEVFVAIEPRDIVRHPVSSEVLGRYFAHVGRVRVLSVQEDTSIAEVSLSCAPVHLDTVLQPYAEEPVPTERRTAMRAINDPASHESLVGAPTIVHARDGLVALAQDHVVFVNVGDLDQAAPGDLYTIYRVTQTQQQPVVLGELAILSVRGDTSLARILESRFPIYLGDVLERK